MYIINQHTQTHARRLPTQAPARVLPSWGPGTTSHFRPCFASPVLALPLVTSGGAPGFCLLPPPFPLATGEVDNFHRFLFFFLFRAAQAGSQARGRIRAAAATCITDTATWGLRCTCDLHHSSGQHQILNPLSEAREGTCILMDPSRVC